MLRKEKFHFFFECAFSRNSVAGEKSDFGTIFCIVGCSCGIRPFGIINMKRGQAAKPVDRPYQGRIWATGTCRYAKSKKIEISFMPIC